MPCDSRICWKYTWTGNWNIASYQKAYIAGRLANWINIRSTVRCRFLEAYVATKLRRSVSLSLCNRCVSWHGNNGEHGRKVGAKCA